MKLLVLLVVLLLFILLKVTGEIALSWWLVLLPFYGMLVITIAIVLIAVVWVVTVDIKNKGKNNE